MSKKKRGGSKGTSKILPGYVQKGKLLIPPMKALPKVKSYSYVDQLLPELIWLGLIHEHSGYRAGGEVIRCIVETSKKWTDVKEHPNYAMQSSYALMPSERKDELVAALRSRDLLGMVQDSIAPLVLLYDRCALRFIGPPSRVTSVEGLTNRIERVVKEAMDKYATPGIMLHGALFLNNLINGKLHFASHIEMPNFDAVIDDPDSVDGKRAASFLRASAMAMIGFAEPPSQWAEEFWRTSYTLRPCEGESGE